MQLSLAFRILAAPIERKSLFAFRKNAGWSPENEAALQGAMHPGGSVQWATVETRGKRIGIARLEFAPQQFCCVSELIVLKEHRRRGVGEWFMKHIELHCLGLGIPRVLLEPLQGSRGFYEKLHFTSDPYVAGFLKKEISPLRRRMLPV